MGVARCALGHAVRGQGDLDQARQLWVQELRLSTEKGSFPLLVYALPGTALVLLDGGELERAVELYELACRFGAVAHSRWFEDVAGKHIETAAAILPPDAVAEAQERGRSRDPWAAATELLIELGE
jgi:hypothetical protein